MNHLGASARRAACCLCAALSLIAVASYPCLSFAQETPDPPIKESVEEIVITGSRIKREELESFSPVTVLNEDEFSFTGNTRVEDLIIQLPQAVAAQNSTVANGASGTATVNLRQLGAERTLVLINGRRMGAGDVFDVAPDLNFVPSTMVKRVDVLTGGASSVYGTDAVAGVVNFIVDDAFEGAKVDFQTSLYQHDNDNHFVQKLNRDLGFDYPNNNATDGEAKQASLALGRGFLDDRAHVSGYLTYREIQGVVKSARDFTNCTVNAGRNGPICSGSTTTPRGRFLVPRATLDNGTVVPSADFVLDLENGAGDSFRPFNSSDVFNFGPFNHLQRPDEKWSAGGFGKYQFSESVEAYVDLMWMKDETDAQIAPSGNFGNTTTINCDNPLLSPQQRDMICTSRGFEASDFAPLNILRRSTEGGNRTNIIEHQNWRMVGGLKGEITDGWDYDVYGLYARNESDESYINDLHTERLAEALDVVTDPATGMPVCRSGKPGCVPWNIFEKDGVTPEALSYIGTDANMKGTTETVVVDASVSGDLGFASPFANDNFALALGTQYRSENLKAEPDMIYELGLRAGAGGATPRIDDGFDVKEVFAETLIPLIQDKPFADDVSVELAYRFSYYDNLGSNNTYKTQLSWTPIPDARLRLGHNRAVRAPNALELFRPTGSALGGTQDICANGSSGRPSATLEQCIRTGVKPEDYGSIAANPANQYNTRIGGNETLEPETADTFTFGLVLQPRFLEGFAATVDYYRIKISEEVGSLNANDIIQTCANTGDPTLCGFIHRGDQGTLWLGDTGYTETLNQNVGKEIAEGIDANVSYSLPLDAWGDLNFNVVGTYIMHSEFSTPLTSYDCAGFYGEQCGIPDAKWRHRARLSWNTGFGATFSAVWRFVGHSEIDDKSSNPNLGNPAGLMNWKINGIDKLGHESYYDVVASYEVLRGLKATIGVNNVLDKEPPLLPTLSSTGYTSTYDPLGRYLFLRFAYQF